MLAIKKLLGVFFISIFTPVLWSCITHKNSITEKFGKTSYIEDDSGNIIPENIGREFKRQDEDMANAFIGIVSFIIIVLSVVFLILR